MLVSISVDWGRIKGLSTHTHIYISNLYYIPVLKSLEALAVRDIGADRNECLKLL